MDPKDAIDVTDDFIVDDALPEAPKLREREDDPHRIAQRQKQVDFGKNTVGYQLYTQQVPRKSRTRDHPWTPDVHQKCSKRAFDGQVKRWRRMLHAFDLPSEADNQATGTESPTIATEAKNVQVQRQANGLPLKLSGMRPQNSKRARPFSFLSALLSPNPTAPKQAKNIKEETKEESHPGNALMAKWRAMASNNKEAKNDIVQVQEEEVIYEEEEEAIDVQPMVVV